MLKEKLFKTIGYRGVIISIYAVNHEKYGRILRAENNYGEPYLDNTKYFPAERELDLIEREQNNIDLCIAEDAFLTEPIIERSAY